MKKSGSRVILRTAIALSLSTCLFAADTETENPISIPGGAFVMGAEVEDDHQPPHEVRVDGFVMDRREVTNAEYAEFCRETDRDLPEFWGIKELSSGSSIGTNPITTR